MNKQDLIDRLAREQRELTKADAKLIVELTFQQMSAALADGDRIEFRGLGSFAVKKYRPYQGRNPKTGRKIKVKPKKLPIFRVGRELQKRVNSE
jgi:integration host factor subunit beta